MNRVLRRGPFVFVCDDCNMTPCSCPDLAADLAAERAAHEATKAELGVAKRDVKNLHDAVGRASQEAFDCDTARIRAEKALAASESAHAETRRELEASDTDRIRLGDKIDASVAREAETWRMVEALIEAAVRALLAARTERGEKKE